MPPCVAQLPFAFADEPFPSKRRRKSPVVPEWVETLKGIKARELSRRAASPSSIAAPSPAPSPAQLANEARSHDASAPAEPLPTLQADTCRDTSVTPTAPKNLT